MCDYCNFIGTADEVYKHQKTCLENPNIKCCANCKYAFQPISAYSYGSWNKPNPYLECRYKEITSNQDSSTSTSANREKLPEGNICEHYERGKPGKIVGA